MIEAKSTQIILQKTTLEFENQAVLNPGCIAVDGTIHMFYRAVRRGNFSSIGYCKLKDNTVIERLDHPILVPEYDYERHGLEDPRVVFLEGTYYLFYTAYDGKNALVAYATSTDLIHFTKKGLLSLTIAYKNAIDFFKGLKLQDRYVLFKSVFSKTQGEDVLLWQKDAFLFPQRFNGRYALIHRVLPGIQIIYFDEFSQLTEAYWQKYFRTLGESIIIDPVFNFENWNIGGGCPPLLTEKGWLFIYHAVEKRDEMNVYHAAACLLDSTNPGKVIGRLPYPLFSPSEPWELTGDVNEVVFPTGAIVNGNTLSIYYGAADTIIAAKTFDLQELLSELQRHPVTA